MTDFVTLPARLTLACVAAGLVACAQQAPPPQADNDKLVCNRGYQTGSNIPTTICMTAAEAAAQQSQSARDPGISVNNQLQRPAAAGR